MQIDEEQYGGTSLVRYMPSDKPSYYGEKTTSSSDKATETTVPGLVDETCQEDRSVSDKCEFPDKPPTSRLLGSICK